LVVGGNKHCYDGSNLKKIIYWLHSLSNPILWRLASEEHYRTILKFAKRDDQILEIGSGTGHISYMLSKKGFMVTMNEIRSECLIESLKKFREHGVYATGIFGDCMSIEQHFDFIWSSGIVQCLWGDKRKKFIEHLSKIGDRVLFFYPDTEGGTKEVYKNSLQIPGVDDAKEYPVSDIPKTVKKYFKKVKCGKLLEKDIGLPYKYIWVYGKN